MNYTPYLLIMLAVFGGLAIAFVFVWAALKVSEKNKWGRALYIPAAVIGVVSILTLSGASRFFIRFVEAR